MRSYLGWKIMTITDNNVLKVLKLMNFRPSVHNQIFLDHLEDLINFFVNNSPVEKRKAINMLHGTLGMTNRNILEHIHSLEAWGVIKFSSGNIEWSLDGNKSDKTSEAISEPEPGVIPGVDIKDMLP